MIKYTLFCIIKQTYTKIVFLTVHSLFIFYIKFIYRIATIVTVCNTFVTTEQNFSFRGDTGKCHSLLRK